MTESYSVLSLYSGSKGNSFLVRVGDTRVLIDAGKSARTLCRALAEVGESIEEIDAILITHEHTDHTSALEVLLKKHGIPVHIVGASADRLTSRGTFTRLDRLVSHPPVFTEQIGSLRVTSFPIPHDSAFCVGYIIEAQGTRIGYATDIGHVTKAVRENLLGCESVIIESNHDEQMLMTGSYPYDLKLRIRSDRGHLSNSACAVLCSELFASGTRNIMLAHLSEENNEPDLAFGEVWSAVGDSGLNLKVASQHESVRLV